MDPLIPPTPLAKVEPGEGPRLPGQGLESGLCSPLIHHHEPQGPWNSIHQSPSRCILQSANATLTNTATNSTKAVKCPETTAPSALPSTLRVPYAVPSEVLFSVVHTVCDFVDITQRAIFHLFHHLDSKVRNAANQSDHARAGIDPSPPSYALSTTRQHHLRNITSTLSIERYWERLPS